MSTRKFQARVAVWAMAVAISGGAIAQEPVRPEEYYYGWKGEIIALERSAKTIGLTFNNPVTALQLRGFVDSESQLRRRNTLLPDNRDLGRHVVVPMALPPGLTRADARAQARAMAGRLKNRPDIANAHAVFTVGTEQESMITGFISVAADASRNEQSILDLFAQDNVTLVWRTDYTDIGKIGYRLEVTAETESTTGLDSLALANRYHEHPLIRQAAPAFAPLYQVMTEAGEPDDHYYWDNQNPRDIFGDPEPTFNPNVEQWHFQMTDPAPAWFSVYAVAGDDFGLLENVDKIVIANLDNGVALNYTLDEGPTKVNRYASRFSLAISGHPDLVANQWLNGAETNANGMDDDLNGYDDDYYGWDFVGNDPNTFDDFGDPIPFPDFDSNYPDGTNDFFNGTRHHGTAAAGVAAAQVNNDNDPNDPNDPIQGIAGYCPSCLIMPVRYHTIVYDDADEAYGPAAVYYNGRAERALNYASGHVMNGPKAGQNVSTKADVIALMMAIETYDPLIHMAIKQARANGCVIVIPAGNRNRSLDAYPAFPGSWPEVITVGAVDKDGKRAAFAEDASGNPTLKSSYGWALDVVAPSANPIPSLLTQKRVPTTKFDATGFIVKGGTGTSMAMPQVAGVAALMLTAQEQSPAPDVRLSPTEVQFILRNTTTDLLPTTDPGRDYWTGFGVINAAAAVSEVMTNARSFFLYADSWQTNPRSVMSVADRGLVNSSSLSDLILDGNIQEFATDTELNTNFSPGDAAIIRDPGSVYRPTGSYLPGEEEEFVYRDTNDKVVAWLDTSSSDEFGAWKWPTLYLKGNFLSRGSAFLSTTPPAGSLLIKEPSGSVQAFISPAGNLEVAGAIVQASTFDTSLDQEIWLPWPNLSFRILRVGPDDPPSYLQGFIDSLVADRGIIEVEPGTYGPIDFKGKNIVIRSLEPNNPDVVATTIIDAAGSGSAVTFSGTETEDAALIGFTITGGNAVNGGGINGGGTTARILNNVIVGNAASADGAAIYDCDGLIEGNTIGAYTQPNISLNRGGGLAWCDGVIRKNFIQYNQAFYGGGMSRCYNFIVQNFVYKNTATSRGGGMHACDDATIISNIIHDNSAPNGGGIGYTYNATIEHNTLFENDSSVRGGGLGYCNSTGTIRNNILWGNTAPTVSVNLDQVYPESTIVTYSCVEGGWTGGTNVGNIDDYPEFVSTVWLGSNMGDFLHLGAGSPCIDEGYTELDSENFPTPFRDFDDQGGPLDGPNEIPPDLLPERDMGADEYPQVDVSSIWWENF